MPKSPTRPTQYPSPQWARALHRGKPRHSCRGGRPLQVGGSSEHGHEGHQGVLQQQRAHRHERLLAKIAVRPLPRWSQGGGWLSKLVSFVLGVLPRLFHPHQGALTLLKAFALPLRRGLCHLVLVRLVRFALLVDPLLGHRQRLIELRACTLLMPVRPNDFFAARVRLERPRCKHALAAVFLYLTARSIHPWPLDRLHRLLDLGGSPVSQGLPRRRRDDAKVPRVLWPRHVPRPALDLGAILQGGDLGGRNAGEASMLVVIKHTQPAQALRVERLGQSDRIDRTIDDKEGVPRSHSHLLAVCDDEL